MTLTSSRVQRQALSTDVGAKFPDTEVIFDDVFSTPGDLLGWEQLYSGEYQSVIGWDRNAMVLPLENGGGQIATAIKRITYWERFVRLRLEVWWSVTPWYTLGTNGDPKVGSFAAGFDQAGNIGDRHYLSIRKKFVESDNATVINRHEMCTGTDAAPSWTPLPGQGYPTTPLTSGSPAPVYDGVTPLPSYYPANEGKRNRAYTAIEVLPIAGAYAGYRFNDSKWGSLSPTGHDADLDGFVGQASSLPRFGNGLNPVLDFRALSGANQTGGTLNVYRVRMSGAMA